MRIAVVSDIHGNLTALEAVVADLRDTAPDLILQGGDVADGGADPAAVVDRIRELGWPGIAGNTDEMLFRPESLEEFVATCPEQLQATFAAVGEIAAAVRESLGTERIEWLRRLPLSYETSGVAVVHATPRDLWRAPAASASDSELESRYAGLQRSLVVYGHVHVPFVRRIGELTVANSGSAGMPYDGDPRASYLLLDESGATIRRVVYVVAGEVKALLASGRPHAAWSAKMLQTARPQML